MLVPMENTCLLYENRPFFCRSVDDFPFRFLALRGFVGVLRC